MAASVDVAVVDAGGKPVADAVIYALPRSGGALPKPSRGASIAQVDKQFSPRVTVVQTGTPITFPNRDTVRHHVYSFSPAKPFEIKLYVGSPPEPIVFDKPGDVVLGCNIHDDMHAFVYVVDTPYFAKSDAAGNAVISGLPAGEFNVAIWHFAQAAPVRSQRIVLRDEPRLPAKFTISVRPLELVIPKKQ
ncbi:MAG TPA: methylamine utilization protein [Burkholderiales bacterium]|nr:methylamine utilization protein [Burkholderiales bacterium]